MLSFFLTDTPEVEGLSANVLTHEYTIANIVLTMQEESFILCQHDSEGLISERGGYAIDFLR